MALASASALETPLVLIGDKVIFSLTVILGKRLNCWKTIPIFSRILKMSLFLSVISTPSKEITPFVGFSSKFIERRKVDFPDPEGPMITTTSPFLISRSIPLRTSFLPKYL